jgi:phi LC3 family holin
MINWKVRIKNKWFWLAFIPAVLTLIRAVAALFGFQIDTEAINAQLTAIIEALFAVLVIMGVVVDPTTKGVSDSDRAREYDEPN